jgi:hypothetical protein
MTKNRGELKIRYTLKQRKEDAWNSETVQIFPVSRLKFYLLLAPTLIAIAFVSAFFFSIFFPLFLFCGIILGLCIWWIRRKLRTSNHLTQSFDGKYVVVKNTHIVETKTDKVVIK